MGNRSIGRPASYYWCISFLEDETLYAPYSIAKLVVPERNKYEDIYNRVRKSMGGFARSRLPAHGDGVISEKNQKDHIAWFGKSWKKNAVELDLIPPCSVSSIEEAQHFWIQIHRVESKNEPLNKPNSQPRREKKRDKGFIRNYLEYCYILSSFFIVISLGALTPHSLKVSSTGMEMRIKTKNEHLEELSSGSSPNQGHKHLPRKNYILGNNKNKRKYVSRSQSGFIDFYDSRKEKRISIDRCRCLFVQKDPIGLTFWQNPDRNNAIAALEAEGPTTVYLVNLRSNSVFPDFIN